VFFLLFLVISLSVIGKRYVSLFLLFCNIILTLFYLERGWRQNFALSHRWFYTLFLFLT